MRDLNTLFWIAKYAYRVQNGAALVGAGMLDAWLVTRELTDAARSAGLGRTEIRRTLRSGITAGRRQPLDATDRAA